ncbi:MAG: CPBP family intramembrane metalloprotease [Candidatus Electrothrix sp. AR3]|nr:CPBP family intramembrane metalloprotease [Candidatus Electrothrix sp. AR3]
MEFTKSNESSNEVLPRLRAGRALAVLVIFIGFQIVSSSFIAFLYRLVWILQGNDLQNSVIISEMMLEMKAFSLVGAELFSSIAIIILCSLWFGETLHSKLPEGGAWRFGASNFIAEGLLAGIMLAALYLLTNALFAPPKISLGPIAEMAVTPGSQQLAWSILAVLLAPFIEELLFRGVIFAGFCRSWGMLWAIIVSTLVFVLLHLSEMIYFWPSAIFVSGMALLALWLRLKAQAIGPAVAIHFAYNGILAISVTGATL